MEIVVNGLLDSEDESTSPNWEVSPPPNQSYDQVAEQLTQLHELRIEPTPVSARARGVVTDGLGYDVVDLSSLVFGGKDDVFAHGFGALRLTPHAKREIRKRTGLETTKFFAHQSLEHIQSAWNNYFTDVPASVHNEVRIIARRALPNEDVGLSQGYLRGFVSPKYFDIPDIQIFELLGDAIGADKNNLIFDADMGNSVSSFSVLFPEARSLVHKFDDTAIGGLRWLNSEIGTRCVEFLTYLFRMVCGNGLVRTENGEALFRRQHRKIEVDDLRTLINGAWQNLGAQLDQVVTQMRLLHDIVLPSAKEFILSGVLRQLTTTYLSANRLQIIAEAWDKEPIDTAYGVLQAITRTAAAVKRNRELSLSLSDLADSYVSHTLLHD